MGPSPSAVIDSGGGGRDSLSDDSVLLTLFPKCVQIQSDTRLHWTPV